MKPRLPRRLVKRGKVSVERFDPTRTFSLRRPFATALKRSFGRLKAALVNLVVDEDALGLRERKPLMFNERIPLWLVNAFCPTGPGGGVDPTCPSGTASTRGTSGAATPDGTDVGSVTDAHIEQAAAVPKGKIAALKAKMAATGKAIYAKLPRPLQKAVDIGMAVEHKLEAAYKSGQDLAKGVASELGLTHAQAARAARVMAIGDGVLRWTANIPAVHGGLETGVHAAVHALGHAAEHALAAVGGPVTGAMFLAAKIGYYVPVGSLGFVAYAMGRQALRGRNPLKLIKAARERVRATAVGRDAVAALYGTVVTHSVAMDKAAFAAILLRRLDAMRDDADRDWYEALACAALDETAGDYQAAIVIADKVFKEKLPESAVSNAQAIVINERWRALTDPDKVKAFQDWLRQQLNATVKGQTEEQLWQRYIEEGFRKGMGRSFNDVRKVAGRVVPADVPTEQRVFLQSSFGQPTTVDKVRLLAGRAFDDLDGITSDMSLRMSRVLTDGLVQGQGIREIATALVDEVDLGEARAQTIARTEIIRAHAEGQLNAMEEMGVDEVGVAVEWSTVEDGGVCDLCEPLEGIVLKIEEARGMLPRHPNCRCAWIPANVGEDGEGQKTTKGEIGKAIRTSAKRGADEFAPDTPISRDRPQPISNAVPPTPPPLVPSTFAATPCYH